MRVIIQRSIEGELGGCIFIGVFEISLENGRVGELESRHE